MKKLMLKGLLIFVPGILVTSYYNSKTFRSADDASKSFIEKINQHKATNEKERIRAELLSLKLKMENTLSVQGVLNHIIKNKNRDDFIYRLEWMIASLQQFKIIEGEKVSFESDCLHNFDTIVDPKYLTDDSQRLHLKLRELIGMSKQQELYKQLDEFKKNYMIPKIQYESVFRKLVEEVLITTNSIKELVNSNIVQEYVDDFSICFEATCEPISKGKSKMVVNIARPISYDKAQQLAAHELTHHMQFVLMEEIIEKFPEMKIIQDMGVLSMLHEGGAELAVDLIYDSRKRKASLRNLLPETFKDSDISKILEIESLTWKGSWSHIILIARKFLNNQIDKQELVNQLEEITFKPNNSWPNADFIENNRAYIQSYGWGRELIARYLISNNEYNLEGYVKFMKRPLPPSKLSNLISK